ncbi:molybdenum cofactor biosynthesis protein MoaE [Rhodobacter capsulatus]|uniref:molybdenum cofactor biosynthesis protein MoaE n=1 Tax=Rhodobacter capsulatus TaxID=1061 RepID=UPI0040262E8B
MRVQVQEAAFDFGSELSAFSESRENIGAVVGFLGLVRDDTGNLEALEIEHYPGMCDSAIAAMLEQARGRWDLADALVIHRHGRLAVGAPIMMVATAARHRVAAFEAAEFLMDYLKSRAPFWKKEVSRDGASWVAAKDADEDALARWQG